jgi:L-lactate dehydrogenase complex protein LldG
VADGREQFLRTVRQALGRDQAATPLPKSGESNGESSIRRRAAEIQREAEDNADALMSQLHEAATEAGWNVARVASPAEAADRILRVVQDLEARSIVRSAHDVLDALALDERMARAGVRVTLAAIGDTDTDAQRQEQRASIRASCISADVGLTGVDHAIAETGSVVLLPRRGVSRLVSLLPPVHVAVVRRGEVLPGLDELFALQRLDYIEGDLGSYLNIITGPSRSADIEYTLVTGVHGPGEVHMVLLG